MAFVELFLIALGLSMDAFAVSVCKGLGMRRMNWKNAGLIALFFGGFQALMPLLGWLLGRQFEHYITAFDHWIAFVLLVFIGGKMMYDAFKGEEEPDCGETLNIRELLVLAVATSIDALAVGITFAFLKVQIVPSVITIGVTTFILSLVGIAVGRKFGGWLMQKAQFAGGIILIVIGLKILLEHLGVL